MIIKSNEVNSLYVDSTTDLAQVLHLINGEHFAGAERVQDLLAMALPRFGYAASFACVKPGKFPQVRQSQSPLFELKMRNKLDFSCYREVINLAREHDYKILHAHTPRSLMIGSLAAGKLGIPLVYHVHSPISRDSNRGIANWVNTKIESWGIRQVNKMICVSNSLRGYMRDELGHDSNRLSVVINGVAVVDDLPERQPPAANATWTLGTMALFRPRKGVEILLESMAELKKRGVKVQLRAVGPFESEGYKEEVMSLVARLDIADMITWTGFQKNVNEQLRQMDLFVLPSLYGEGLPMVVLESMANAVPVLASNVEGIPEAVRDGVDGLIFEPSDVIDLADQVESIVGDTARWSSMSQSAFTRQREHLSDVSMAQATSNVYDELLNPDYSRGAGVRISSDSDPQF